MKTGMLGAKRIDKATLVSAAPPSIPDGFARRGEQAPISETALFTTGHPKESDGL